VQAAGLNPVDYKLLNGWGDVQWETAPVLGLDVAGIVEGTGEDVKAFKAGDRVYGHGDLGRVNGGFAEYACLPAYAAAALPEPVRPEEAAALPCAGFSAYQAIAMKLRAQEGKTILIHAGAGGVGGYAIQLAKLRNLKIFTTCSERNNEYVRSLGADTALNYDRRDIYRELLDLTGGRGVDYIVNTLDSASATKDIDVLAFQGELAAVVEHPDFSRLRFYEKAMSIHEIALGGAHGSSDEAAKRQIGEIAEIIADLVVKGKIKPLPAQVISLREVQERLAQREGRHVHGKIVVSP
jgi:NADPH:quinone reductase-like Zn-dependent oxidoreductase